MCSNKTKTTQTRLHCSECHAEMPISRSLRSPKKAGHVKHMWCWKCKKEQPFIEASRYEAFYEAAL